MLLGDDNMKFKNVNIKKEEKRMKKGLIIGIIIMALSFAIFYLGFKKIDDAEKNMEDLHTIIIKNDDKKSDKRSYVTSTKNPYKFAGYKDTTDAYYFVTDGKYLYVAYLSEIYANSITSDNPQTVKIEGTTKLTPKDVKEIAIDTYNEIFELEDAEKLTLADYNNYFGEVYLDTIEASDEEGFYFAMGVIVFAVGLVLIIVNAIRNISYKNKLKKFTQSDVDKYDKEMEDEESFYYEKSKLYLTPNYIINFGTKFSIINYKDIVWVYPYEHRTNGIKDNQSIIVKDKFGKTTTVASLALITKAKKEEFNEILNTIISKNSNMLVGYTPENISKYKEISKLNKDLGIK